MRPLLVLVSLCSLGRALAQEEFDAKPIVLTEETFDANVSEGFWLLVRRGVTVRRRGSGSEEERSGSEEERQ
jgi:hypothetical protein